MSDVPVELVVAAFADEDGASRALKQLQEARKEKLIGIKDAAVIQRGEDNKLHIRETGDMTGGKGAVIGGLVGAAIGIVAAPAVLVAGGIGAAIGGLAARLRDSGFSDDRLRELGEALKPGTSALVAVIEHKWVAEVERELARFGAQMVIEDIKADIAEQLETEKVVSLSGTTAEDTVTTGEHPEAREAKTGAEPGAVSPEATAPQHPTEEQPPQSSHS